jgi:hypothetical protein
MRIPTSVTLEPLKILDNGMLLPFPNIGPFFGGGGGSGTIRVPLDPDHRAKMEAEQAVIAANMKSLQDAHNQLEKRGTDLTQQISEDEKVSLISSIIGGYLILMIYRMLRPPETSHWPIRHQQA